MNNYIRFGIVSLAASAVLVGCGSTNTTTSSTDNTTLETGYFIDAAVEGLAYETASGVKGTTDAYGRFHYRAGEKVRFLLGKLDIGEATPDQEGLVTPQTLAKADDALKVRLLRVLQSLDSDNNPENGITISKEILDTLGNIGNERVKFSNFKDDNELMKLNGDLAEKLDHDYDGHIDVDAQKAKEHFANSMNRWKGGHKPDQDSEASHGKGKGNFQGQGNGQGNRKGNDKGHGAEHKKGFDMDLSAYPLAELTTDQKYSLAYMWNEEKLAKDIYLALNELYPTNQFYNIATRSETRHEEKVEELVQRYDINITNLQDYTVNYSEAELRALPAGTYGVDKIQELYDTLYTKGEQSKTDALQVACMVEVTDIEDLDRFITTAQEVNATDLVAVFERLREGSYNHYWAFDKALKTEGVTDGCASAGEAYAKTTEEYPTSH